MRILTFLLLATMSVCQAKPTLKYPCNLQDHEAIQSAITTYLDKSSAIPSDQVMIFNEQCLASYAIAKVAPKKPVTDKATVYLRKVKNNWEVISIGTHFDEKFLSTIPKELRGF